MGGCLSSKQKLSDQDIIQAQSFFQYKPIFKLKDELLKQLQIDDEYFYKIFCSYRFKNSVRMDKDFQKGILTIRQIVLERVSGNTDDVHLKKIKTEDVQLSASDQIELKDGTSFNLSTCQQIQDRDEQILVSSWIDNLGYTEKDFDDKVLFFNSENILNQENLLQHFNRDNLNDLFKNKIEVVCKKGQGKKVNKDSFFCINQNDCKIFAVLDGHGENGHLVSNFAMGCLADFIKHSKWFKNKNFEEYSDDEMQKAIRKCFRYAQDRLKEQFAEYLISQKKKKIVESGVLDYLNEENEKDSQVDNKSLKKKIESGKKEELQIDFDSDEKEFLDNISWDTESDEEDLIKDEKIAKKYLEGNKNRQKSVDSKSKNSPRKAQLEKCEKFYNFFFHNFKKNYRQITPEYKELRAQKQKKINANESEQVEEQRGKQKNLNQSFDSIGEENISVDSYELEIKEMESYNEFEDKMNGKNLKAPAQKPQQIKNRNQEQGQLAETEKKEEPRDNEDLKKRIQNRQKNEQMFDILLSGTSATLIIQLQKKIYIGWVGDSKVSICSKSREDQFINEGHKPEHKSEKYRIYSNRGEIKQINDVPRVYLRGRMYPGQKTSRSFGDLISHQIGVTSEPQFKAIEIQSNDKFLLVASDGLWQYIDPQDIQSIVNEKNLDKGDGKGTLSQNVFKKLQEVSKNQNRDATILISYF